MSKISEQIEKFIEPIVTGLGYEIVEVEFAKKHNGDNLTVFIDKKEGYIDITDCPNVTDKDYNRNLGQVLEVKLFQAILKKKIFI